MSTCLRRPPKTGVTNQGREYKNINVITYPSDSVGFGNVFRGWKFECEHSETFFAGPITVLLRSEQRFSLYVGIINATADQCMLNFTVK